jgi:L-fucose isomerase-like protein
MNTPTKIPAKGVASDVIASIVPPRPRLAPTKIGLIGVGLKMHFVWKDAVANYRQAQEVIRDAWRGVPLELVAPEGPFESAEEVLTAIERLRASGISGLILFHGSYTAGEIGSQLGRWLCDHPLPLLSWAFPEPVGGRLTANSLCCQNFLLNVFHRLGVRYHWMFQALNDPGVREFLIRFGRAARARAGMINGKLLHLGSGRVPGFYDAEADELAVFKRFGLRFDRVDFVQIFDRAQKFSDTQLRSVMKAIVDAPNCGLNNVNDTQFLQTLRLALGTLDCAAQQNYVGTAIRCWPDLWDHWSCAADGALSLINDQGLPAADETDMNGLITMMAMHLITEGAAVATLMDISLLDARKNRLGFWHCGGSATRLVRTGTKFETRRHSIMENADESTAVGMLVESLLELGPVTVARYLAPDSSCAFLFEGRVTESPMAFRGAYAEVEPVGVATADCIMGTILDKGLDHHWVMGREHFADDLRLLNHMLNVIEEPVTNSGGCRGSSTTRKH